MRLVPLIFILQARKEAKPIAEGHRGRGRYDFGAQALPTRVMWHSLLKEGVGHRYPYEHGRLLKEGDPPKGLVDGDRNQLSGAKGPRNPSLSGL